MYALSAFPLGCLRVLIFLCVFMLALQPVSTQAAEPAEIAERAARDISQSLSNDDLDRLDQLVANETNPVGLEAYGHVLLMERHLDQAAYIFARTVTLSPGQASALTALGATLNERIAVSGQLDATILDDAISLQTAALAALPTEPMIKHNMGTALLRAAVANGGDDKLVRRAINHLREAVAQAPNNSMFRTRLAEALQALADIEQAQIEVNQTFVTDPISPHLQAALGRGSLANYSPSPTSNMCNVNFNCEASCPGGMIGGVKRVTCEIAQSSAQNACISGEIHAISYNCDIEIPRFGVMIPGLYPGFSVLTPWGSFDLLVQGGGRLDWRVKLNTPNVGPMQFYMSAEGQYEPHSGATTWDYGGGIQYAILNRNDAIRAANQYDIGPQLAYHINPLRQDPDEVRLEISRGTLVGM